MLKITGFIFILIGMMFFALVVIYCLKNEIIKGIKEYRSLIIIRENSGYRPAAKITDIYLKPIDKKVLDKTYVNDEAKKLLKRAEHVAKEKNKNVGGQVKEIREKESIPKDIPAIEETTERLADVQEHASVQAVSEKTELLPEEVDLLEEEKTELLEEERTELLNNEGSEEETERLKE